MQFSTKIGCNKTTTMRDVFNKINLRIKNQNSLEELIDETKKILRFNYQK